MLDLGLISSVAGLLGLTVREVLNGIKTKAQENKDRKAADLIRARQVAGERIARDGLLKETVIQYYQDRKLKDVGLEEYRIAVNEQLVHTGVAVLPEWVGLNNPLNNVHENASLLTPPTPLVEYPQEQIFHLLNIIELMKLRLWGGPIYRLLDVDFSLGLTRSSFAVDEFLRYRFSVGLVIDELVDALSKCDFSVKQVLKSAADLLPIRSKFLADGPSFLDFQHRICAGGVTMVFAIPRGKPFNDFIFPVQQRSALVTDGNGMLSIIPRGFHEFLVDAEKEVAPSFSCYREIFEELFGGEEVEQSSNRLRYDWFFRENSMRWFVEHKTDYELICTCFGIDMVSGNYQFGTLLIIHDESYWDTFGNDMVTNWEGEHQGTKLHSTKDSADLANLIKENNWTGEGLQTLCEGLQCLEARYPQKVLLPPIRRL